jgi:hypothetical protein
MHPLVKKLAVFLFISASLYSSLIFLSHASKVWKPGTGINDPAADWDSRLAGLRTDLPPDLDEVGYISSKDVLPEYDIARDETEYLLTQYALAPVIVTRGDQPAWVIVNLEKNIIPSWLLSRHATLLVTEYEHGLYLVHRP